MRPGSMGRIPLLLPDVEVACGDDVMMEATEDRR